MDPLGKFELDIDHHGDAPSDGRGINGSVCSALNEFCGTKLTIATYFNPSNSGRRIWLAHIKSPIAIAITIETPNICNKSITTKWGRNYLRTIVEI